MWVKSKFENYSLSKKVLSLHGLHGLRPLIKYFVISSHSKVEKSGRNLICLFLQWLWLQYERQSNRALLPKWHDNSRFSSQLTKIKDNTKAALLSSNPRILGLIWWGTAYFVVNDPTIFLPGDSVWRARCRTLATHFWHLFKSLKTQNVPIFPFGNLRCFCNNKSLFSA